MLCFAESDDFAESEMDDQHEIDRLNFNAIIHIFDCGVTDNMSFLCKILDTLLFFYVKIQRYT